MLWKSIEKKYKKKLNIISMLYIFIFYYQIILNFLIFRPLVINVIENNYENTELLFFPNQTCAYFWKKNGHVQPSKFLFYVNGFEGNCSTRFNVMKTLLNTLPGDDFTIVQFELAGFGLSSHIECNLTAIQICLLENMNYMIDHFPTMTEFHLMTENEGFVSIVNIVNKLKKNPLSIICLNAYPCLYEYLKWKYGRMSLPFYFSLSSSKKHNLAQMNQFYEKNGVDTKFYFLKNDDFCHDDFNIYFDLDTIPPKQKERITITGKGPTSLLLHENQTHMENLLQNLS